MIKKTTNIHNVLLKAHQSDWSKMRLKQFINMSITPPPTQHTNTFKDVFPYFRGQSSSFWDKTTVLYLSTVSKSRTATNTWTLLVKKSQDNSPKILKNVTYKITSVNTPVLLPAPTPPPIIFVVVVVVAISHKSLNMPELSIILTKVKILSDNKTTFNQFYQF